MEFKPYKNQDFHTLKGNYDSHNLFEDPEFPPDSRSIYHFKPPQGINPDNIQWFRPRELCNDPQFIANNIEPRDLDQGSLGNCWFVAGCIVVSSRPAHIDNIVPKDQSFDEGYNGMFHFRFW